MRFIIIFIYIVIKVVVTLVEQLGGEIRKTIEYPFGFIFLLHFKKQCYEIHSSIFVIIY